MSIPTTVPAIRTEPRQTRKERPLLAAQQNFAMAQRSLGELYENGSGIALDITIASHWYRLAALQGYSTAKEHLLRLAQPNTLCKKGNQSTQQGPP